MTDHTHDALTEALHYVDGDDMTDDEFAWALCSHPDMQAIARVYEAAVALYRVSVADDTDTLPMEWDRLHVAVAAALEANR